MTYAKWMFYAYGRNEGSKVNRIAQWRQVEKTSGIVPDGLRNKPGLPRALVYIWEMYTEIKKGCEDVTYQEMIAFCNLTGENLTPWEVSLIIEIDLLRRRQND